jgi:hypothetical protein
VLKEPEFEYLLRQHFSPFHVVQIDFGAHPVPSSMNAGGGLFQG